MLYMKSLLYWTIGFFVLLGIYAILQFNGKDKSVVVVPVTYTRILSTTQTDSAVLVTFEGGATSTIPRDPMFGEAQEVKVVDINFDGKDDVLIAETAGAYNLSTHFYIFNEEKKVFEEYNGFAEALQTEEEYIVLGSVDFDQTQKTLKSFFKGRGLGDLYTSSEFTFKDGRWYESKSEVQDILNYDVTDPSQWYYYRTTVTYDPMRATTSESVTYYDYVQNSDGSEELVEVPKSVLVKKKLIK